MEMSRNCLPIIGEKSEHDIYIVVNFLLRLDDEKILYFARFQGGGN